jgi:hypothetical protein
MEMLSGGRADKSEKSKGISEIMLSFRTVRD